MIRRLELQLSTTDTHFLESQGQAGMIRRSKLQQGTTATHFLKSQGQTQSAGQNYSKAPQPLTPWRAKDRYNQQARTAARHYNHSLPEKSRTVMIVEE